MAALGRCRRGQRSQSSRPTSCRSQARQDILAGRTVMDRLLLASRRLRFDIDETSVSGPSAQCFLAFLRRNDSTMNQEDESGPRDPTRNDKFTRATKAEWRGAATRCEAAAPTAKPSRAEEMRQAVLVGPESGSMPRANSSHGTRVMGVW